MLLLPHGLRAEGYGQGLDADAGPTAIAHGWTLEELWRDGGA
jgi:hypothetical protein